MRQRLWLVYLVTGVLASATYLLVPRVNAGPVFNVIGLSAAVMIVLAARMHRPARRLPWYLFATGQVLFVCGDVIAYNYTRLFGADLPYPALSDLFYLGVYPCFVAGVLLLIRHRSPGRDRASLIDSIIIFVGAGALSWVYLMAPYAHDPSLTLLQKVISIAYPLMDLILLTVVTRLAVGGGHRSPALYLLLGSAVCLLTTDAIYGWILLNVSGGYTTGGLLDGGWALFYLLLGATALHPTMLTLDTPTPRPETAHPGRRLLILAGASLMAPGVLFFDALRDRPTDVPFLAGASAVIFCLVLVRLRDLMIDVNAEKEASDRLRALNDMQNSFLLAVSHDLRTPLTAILGSAQMLTARWNQLEVTELQEVLRGLGKNADKLSRLLTNLLDLDRISRGIIEPKRVWTDLNELISAVVEEYEDGERPIRTDVCEPVMAAIDVGQVERIIENLISNAVRHTPTGTPIRVRAESQPEGVLLVVEDEGPGVPEELRKVVFEAFRRGGGTGVHSPGVGVGLTLVARFADLHGGRAWVERRDGGGASFRVYLPNVSADGASADPSAEAGVGDLGPPAPRELIPSI
jgi:signal transduction histidine kinase